MALFLTVPRSGAGMDGISGRAFVMDDGVDLDLNQPVRVYKTRYLHDCIDRPDVPEELATVCSDCLPVIDSGE